MSAGARLTIDLGALISNYNYLAKLAAPAKCAAVIKADAYGIGVEPALKALSGAGCGTFFVATLGEAEAARKVNSLAEIYVFDGLLPGAAKDFMHLDVRPVLGSLPEIDEWAEYGGRHEAAIHIDTGMKRLGLDENDLQRLKPEQLAGINISLIMSHLACADMPDNLMNARQLKSFKKFRSGFPPATTCMANSGGVFLGRDYHFDMVRPGIALYGGEAVTGVTNPMRGVVKLEAQIVQIREIRAGETVGYGAAYKSPAPARIATIPVGYADGYFRYLGHADERHGANVYIGGMPAPLAGRVSMDLITVDVTGIDPDHARRGAWVELIGEHISVDDLARAADTIGYEILTSLGRRYDRKYI